MLKSTGSCNNGFNIKLIYNLLISSSI